MPIQVRPIAVSSAVVFFFAVGIVGSVSGLSPFVCCKKALIAAVLAYVLTTIMVRAVNAIITSAIIEHQLNKQREEDGGGKH